MDIPSVRVALMLHVVLLRLVLPVEMIIFLLFRTNKVIEKLKVFVFFVLTKRMVVSGRVN